MRDEAKTWWLFSGPNVTSSYVLKENPCRTWIARSHSYWQLLLTWSSRNLGIFNSKSFLLACHKNFEPPQNWFLCVCVWFSQQKKKKTAFLVKFDTKNRFCGLSPVKKCICHDKLQRSINFRNLGFCKVELKGNIKLLCFRLNRPIEYWSVTPSKFLFCISTFSWPYFSRTW